VTCYDQEKCVVFIPTFKQLSKDIIIRPPQYNWNIVESGVKHHNPNPIIRPICHDDVLIKSRLFDHFSLRYSIKTFFKVPNTQRR
jgi:hypothetical protein